MSVGWINFVGVGIRGDAVRYSTVHSVPAQKFLQAGSEFLTLESVNDRIDGGVNGQQDDGCRVDSGVQLVPTKHLSNEINTQAFKC